MVQHSYIVCDYDLCRKEVISFFFSLIAFLQMHVQLIAKLLNCRQPEISSVRLQKIVKVRLNMSWLFYCQGKTKYDLIILLHSLVIYFFSAYNYIFVQSNRNRGNARIPGQYQWSYRGTFYMNKRTLEITFLQKISKNNLCSVSK